MKLIRSYITITKSQRALIVKLMVCTVLATFFSWAIGDIYTPTTAVTANLCLYVDRGYRGNILYAVRRILAQLIQGILVLAFIFPCKYFALPISDGVLIVASCCFAIAIGLPLNYKHTFAPLNCTLANATFIISCAAVQRIDLFPMRVLQCIVGALIGYFVNYVVFPYQDREKEILHLADRCLTALIHNRDFDDFSRNMALLEKEYAFVIADKGKKRRTAHMTEAEILFLCWNKEALQKFSAFISVYEVLKDQITDSCKNLMWELLPDALEAHRQIITEGPSSLQHRPSITIPRFHAEHRNDVILLSRLFEYLSAINQYEDPLVEGHPLS